MRDDIPHSSSEQSSDTRQTDALQGHQRIQGSGKPQRSLVFAGEPDKMPQCLMEVLEREFPWLCLEQVGDLHSLTEEFQNPVSLILLDGRFLSDLDMYWEQIARTHPNGGLAVWFDDLQSASLNYAEIMAQPVIRGVLPMNLRLDHWLAIVALLLRGGEYMPTALARSHPQSGATLSVPGSDARFNETAEDFRLQKHAAPDVTTLTEREFQVVELVAKGASNRLIATDLGLSEHTVKIHMHHIIRKLRVRNRTEAAAIFLNAESRVHASKGR